MQHLSCFCFLESLFGTYVRFKSIFLPDHFDPVFDDLLNSMRHAEIKELKDKMETDMRARITSAQEAKEQAEKAASEYQKNSQQAEKEAAAAKEQADTANSLVAEKQKINDMLSAKLAEAEAKIENYDALKNELEEAQRKITELNHEMAENQRAAEYEKASLQAEMERKLSEKVKDAELILERTMAAKEKEKADAILELQKQNAVLQAKVEMLQDERK